MKLFRWALLLLVWGSVPVAVRAAEGVSYPLRGLSGVEVIVEGLDQNAERAGLHKDQVVTDAELRLRTAGIQVLSPSETLNTKGRPWLYVQVTALPHGTAFIYSVNVELYQNALLDRGESTKLIEALSRTPPSLTKQEGGDLFFWPLCTTSVATWETGCLGYGSLENIHQAVREKVDEFANAYLAANPKK